MIPLEGHGESLAVFRSRNCQRFSCLIPKETKCVGRDVVTLEQNRKLPILFSEALGKVSPKIRRLRRLPCEGSPEQGFSRS